MDNYEQLVKALRCRDIRLSCNECKYGRWSESGEAFGCDFENMVSDAAAAIEELQAEVKRLKECNDELREAQTYIDHYGDKWMTSAKDVPTSAYNHGYMDGKNEAEQALEPKRGEWISEDLDNFRKYKVTCPHCGAWYIGNYDAYDEPSDFNYCPHCGNICNPQNIEWEKMQAERTKMEVQE